MSTLISLLIFVLISGLIFWVITLIPMPPPFKTIALIILGIIAIVYLLGMLPGGSFPQLMWR